jgi:ABC-type Fe3+-hydroxamate transport system substrate-binding protein
VKRFSFTDDLGQEIHLKHAPKRIISLVPSVTLSLFDLGLGDCVVGRTKFCTEPEGLVEEVAVVGGTKKVDRHKINALQPDLILCNKEENTKDIYESLRPIAPVWVSDVISIDDNYRLLTQLGYIGEKEAEARAFIQGTQENLAGIRGILEGQKVLYLIWKDPYMSIGHDTFIHHILAHLGLVNICRQLSRYPPIEPTDPTLEQPDLIFLSSEPFPFKAQHLSEIQLFYPTARVMLVDGAFFSWYGTKMLHAASYFRSILF